MPEKPGQSVMSNFKRICVAIAIVGALVGFLAPASAPVLSGLGKAIFGVFFELFLIAYLMGGLEASGSTGKVSKAKSH